MYDGLQHALKESTIERHGMRIPCAAIANEQHSNAEMMTLHNAEIVHRYEIKGRCPCS